VNTDLSKLAPGEKARITAIGALGPMKRRLMDMGLLPGEEVKVEKVAPLGDPIEVRIRSYHLSLRKKEAEGIAVEVAP
jgi:ferrous iron transport protein A